ncbi:MAG: hypothetical protein JST10_02380 [Bacteroidetes bacterium]|nr:hypothetical protein [Bacteroidota bacterium]MBS1631398.1 hypothetical protein [Bacteroidota bacterium]
MSSNRFSIKCFAVLFLILFSQKVAIGMYLHFWLHTTTPEKTLLVADKSKSLNVNCHCINQFFMPCADDNAVYEITHVANYSVVGIFDLHTYSSLSFCFQSLRAPPAYFS